jgi:polyisoprenoid-binding protein YceI
MLPRFISTILLALVLATGSLFAQDQALTLNSGYEVTIDGTSNARDWDAKVTQIEAEFVLNGFEGNDLSTLQPEHFKSLKINMSAQSIDADGRRLTNNIREYIKADDHPTITFELIEIKNINASGNTAEIQAEGIVTAAGVSHTIDMTVNAERNSSGSFIFSGVQDLKMTDFGITPPTAMLGAIRAVDDMSIIYKVSFTL